MTSHNASVHGDRNIPKDLCMMIFMDWQSLEFPPSRRHLKAIVLA